MKIIKKMFLLAAAFSSAAVNVSAQDFDDFGSDDSGFGDYSYDTAEPSVVISGKAETSARIFPRRTDSGFDTYDYEIDVNSLQDKAVSGDASLTLGVDYSGAFTDFSGKIKFNESIFNDYNEDIIQEFTARAYMGNFQLEAGKMKIVWGKGDKVHVLDNFNSNDYTDFIIPDYIDRRLALPMFHAVYNVPSESCFRLEAVYTPYMVADRLASDGMWKPAAMSSLETFVTNIEMGKISSTIDPMTGGVSQATIAALNEATALQGGDQSILYKDNIKSIKFSQAGLRSTWTLGSVDLGLSYYYGHYKQPSANIANMVGYVATPVVKANVFSSYKAQVVAGVRAATGNTLAIYTDDQVYDYAYANQASLGQTIYSQAQVDAALDASLAANGYTLSNALPQLYYDQLQVFGFEIATVIGPFNTRAEVAYNLTKDIDGTDPWVHNNSISWEAGFDINLPIHNMNLNAQTTGKYILHKDDIKNGELVVANFAGKDIAIPIAEYDVDYDNTDKYMRNQVIVDITDNWNYEKIKLDLKGIYQIETKDLMVIPTLTFILADTFELNLSGLYIWCGDEEESEYYAWRNNDFFSVGCRYQF